ncbi:MAG: 30S ribosomal protein S2 [archaeon]|nr:MAG: 30S ribosomal protein S2 [archaeon]
MPRKKKEETEKKTTKKKTAKKKVEKRVTKKEVKEEKKHEEVNGDNLLIPVEFYVKTAVHLGTRAVTPDMRLYMYKRRADGIAVLNTNKINEKIETAAKFLSKFDPKDIVFCCKRDKCEKIVEKFGELTGIKTFTRYAAGKITNPVLSDFFEPEVMFISDPWLDNNALNDAVLSKIPVVALCSTNNLTRYVDFIVPCNNKGPKSIGLVLYLIAKLFLEIKGIKKKIDINDFCEIEEKKEMGLDEARKLIQKKLEERKKKETEK